jgi:hypothetical protein
MVKPAPFTFPPKVAVPDVLVIDTNPVVVNPAILWVAIVLVITIGELPAVNVPPLLITKLPPKVNPRLLVNNLPMLVIVSGLDNPKTLAALRVILFVPLITIPPKAVNGEIHSSEEAFLIFVVSYCKVALEP